MKLSGINNDCVKGSKDQITNQTQPDIYLNLDPIQRLKSAISNTKIDKKTCKKCSGLCKAEGKKKHIN